MKNQSGSCTSIAYCCAGDRAAEFSGQNASKLFADALKNLNGYAMISMSSFQ